MGTITASSASMASRRMSASVRSARDVGALMRKLSKITDAQFRREHFPHIRAELLVTRKCELPRSNFRAREL